MRDGVWVGRLPASEQCTRSSRRSGGRLSRRMCRGCAVSSVRLDALLARNTWRTRIVACGCISSSNVITPVPGPYQCTRVLM